MVKLVFVQIQLTLLTLLSTGAGERRCFAQSDDGASLLRKLQKFDQTIEMGFTVEGTKIDIPPAGFVGGNLPPTRLRWKLSLSGGKFGYESSVQEVLSWREVVGPDGQIPERDEEQGFAFTLRTKIYLDRDVLAEYDYFTEPIFTPGKVAPTTDEQPGPVTSGSLTTHSPKRANAYGFKNDPLWAMGRGYSAFINRISSIKRLDDGRLAVKAEGKNEFPHRWALVIDPQAGYLVRNSKFLGSDGDAPHFEIRTFGTKWIGSVSIPERYKLLQDTGHGEAANEKLGGAFTKAAASADVDFLKEMKLILTSPHPVPTVVVND